MCGICGYINPEGRPVDRDLLDRMNAAIRHRGPDSDGFFVRDHVGLAMRRLAILDLVTGDQPMSNEAGDIWIVFNGEIYNYPELRPQLEARGHVFRTHADTEAIVHLYEDFGDDCVQHLRGMFAFAIWDARRGRLLLARDRLGKKPLYYAQHAQGLVFGSEIKALLEVPTLPRDIDLEAINHYLTLQYVPDPLTGFQHIRKLPPAHRLIWERGALRVERYWDLPYGPKWTAPDAELAEDLRTRLREAVRLRLLSDVPLGAHLSGGLDSSLIVALMSEAASGPVKTFSIGFEEAGFSELPYARAVAQRYGTEHHEFVVSYGDVPDMMQRLARQFDEPFADSSALPLHHLSRLTRQHVTVALNGDGGDEIFAGYQRYRLDRFANLYARLPRAITQQIMPALLKSAREPVNVPIEANWVAGLKRLAQVAAITPDASIVRWGSYFDEAQKAALWRPDRRHAFSNLTSADWLAKSFRSAPATSFLDRTLYTDTTNYLPGDLLVKADRMTMANSLEGRSPFLDHMLVEWVARLPEHCKLRGSTHKYLLRAAFAEHLPPAVSNRGKRGFGIPLGAWFRGPLAAWSREVLCDPQARIGQLFDLVPVSTLVQEHTAGRTDHGKRLWTLLMLEFWLRLSKAT
ncbi:MAG: asparagine synthase (glutamine-hydrolyzing) [Lentisphaerae bacterium]|nr:asparagine synthase (glutamine-hydrolyzing) [Lentisphaerota bacterium]